MQNYAGFEGCVKEPFFNAVKVVSTLQQVLDMDVEVPGGGEGAHPSKRAKFVGYAIGHGFCFVLTNHGTHTSQAGELCLSPAQMDKIKQIADSIKVH